MADRHDQERTPDELPVPFPGYRPRVAEADIQDALTRRGAVLIEGVRWCGKTSTALRFASSVLRLDDPDALTLADADPGEALRGEVPRAPTSPVQSRIPESLSVSVPALRVEAAQVDGYPHLGVRALRIGALVADPVCEAVLEAILVVDVEVVRRVLDDALDHPVLAGRQVKDRRRPQIGRFNDLEGVDVDASGRLGIVVGDGVLKDLAHGDREMVGLRRRRGHRDPRSSR